MLFTAPTLWAYDLSRMLYGAMFVLGAGYGLSKGVHIRSDFLYRKWTVRNQARVDAALYIVFYFPAMIVLLRVSTSGRGDRSRRSSAGRTPRGCRSSARSRAAYL